MGSYIEILRTITGNLAVQRTGTADRVRGQGLLLLPFLGLMGSVVVEQVAAEDQQSLEEL